MFCFSNQPGKIVTDGLNEVTEKLRNKMNKNIALGVDLGWVNQLEEMGYSWVDDSGDDIDPIEACKKMGANAVRFRIFVNPPKDAIWQKHEDETCMLGYCDAESVTKVAARARDLDMDIMLDFHYSDHFADLVIQDIPDAWKDDDDDTLTQKVYLHTVESLRLFKEAGIEPKWVQVGNEINNGMMWPKGSLKDSPVSLVRFLNAGYDAVKEIFPNCLVITHMAGIQSEELCVPFLDNFLSQGGRTDIIGFSYYPYWVQSKSNFELLCSCLCMYEKKYDKPVLIAEVGGEDSDEEESLTTIRHCVEAIRSVPNGRGLGVFYWEPEVDRRILPDHYPLGAARLVGERKLQCC